MIDVIIPAYNCKSTLERTLGSLVAQTDPNFKVIIVDHCSTEDIKSIVDDYSSKLKITYIRNEENIGCGMSRQAGIDNSSSDFFCFIDADDVFMPYTVETFNSIIEANPQTEYIHSYFYEQTYINGDHVIILKKDGFTWCHGKLYNRSLINKFGIKNSPFTSRWADDSYFNSMCSELLKWTIVRIPTYLWCYNANSATRKDVQNNKDKSKTKIFLTAMEMSAKCVLQYKDKIDHLDQTINYLKNNGDVYDEEEQEIINRLLQFSKE